MDQPSASTVLCDKCHGLCENGTGWCWVNHPNGEKYPSVYLHHPSLHILKAKAAQGCPLCSMILRTLVEFCKLDLETSEDRSRLSRPTPRENEDHIERIVTRVQDIGILEPLATHSEPRNEQTERTHSFHPVFEQEKFQRLRSIFGSERVLIKVRTLKPRDVGDKLPDLLSVMWLGAMKTCVSRHSTGLGRISLLIDHSKIVILFDLLFCPLDISSGEGSHYMRGAWKQNI